MSAIRPLRHLGFHARRLYGSSRPRETKMIQKSGPEKHPAEDPIRDVRRATRRHLPPPPELQFLVHPSLIDRMPSWLEGSCGDCGCPSGKGLATTAQRTWRQSRKWAGSAKATKVRGRALQGPQQGKPNALVLPSSTSTTQTRSARGRRARIARGDWTVGRADPHLDRHRECGGLDFRSRARPRICVTAGAS